jgi:hypothetical protein
MNLRHTSPLLLLLFASCICTSSGVDVSSATVMGGERSGTLVLTEVDDIPEGLALDVRVSARSGGSVPVRLDLALLADTRLVGEGEGQASVTIPDVDRRLSACGGECRIPLTITTPGGDDSWDVVVGTDAQGVHDCEDTFILTALEF